MHSKPLKIARRTNAKASMREVSAEIQILSLNPDIWPPEICCADKLPNFRRAHLLLVSEKASTVIFELLDRDAEDREHGIGHGDDRWDEPC